MQGYYDTGKQYGIERPEQFKEIGELYKTLNTQGIKPSQLASVFAKDVANVAGEDAGTLTKAQIEEIIGERVSKAQADMIRREAERMHDSQIDQDYKELEEDKIKSVLGEDAPAELIQLARYAAMGKMGEFRSAYDESHPLKGMFGPVGKDGIGKIQGWLKETTTKLKASQSLAIGAAARKTSASTPAGNVAGQGQPSSSTGRPGGLPTREQLEEAAAKLRAQRGR